ncbi:MAG: HAD family hydrolase, partial [Planctomycetota bacterium]
GFKISELLEFHFKNRHRLAFGKLELTHQVVTRFLFVFTRADGLDNSVDLIKRFLEPFEDASEVLRRLAKTDLRLGIITEGLEIKQSEKLIRLRLLDYFDHKAIFISHQVGISKPNPKLYQRACTDLNLRPSECLYVGDNPMLDIDPANEIGMVTVLVSREDRFRSVSGITEPNHVIQNFWDLSEILREQGVSVPEVL